MPKRPLAHMVRFQRARRAATRGGRGPWLAAGAGSDQLQLRCFHHGPHPTSLLRSDATASPPPIRSSSAPDAAVRRAPRHAQRWHGVEPDEPPLAEVADGPRPPRLPASQPERRVQHASAKDDAKEMDCHQPVGTRRHAAERLSFQSALSRLTYLSCRKKKQNSIPCQTGEKGCRATHTKSQTTRCPLSRPPADVCSPRARPPPAAGRSLVASVTGAPRPPYALGGQRRELFPAVHPRCDARLVTRHDAAAAHGTGGGRQGASQWPRAGHKSMSCVVRRVRADCLLSSLRTGSVALSAVQKRAAASGTPAACGQFQEKRPTFVAHSHELGPLGPWSTAVPEHAARPGHILLDTPGHRKQALRRRP